ncbi:MAG: hypothetical protein HKN16_10855, partial [Saprospiraceae bacterium]|nr:hypothetical protein [Saprospiraceae bacterium]
NRKSGEFFSDDCMIKTLSSNTIDVYARIEEKNEGMVDLTVWFDLGGAYLSSQSHPEVYPQAVQLLEEYQLSVSTMAIEAEIKEQEGTLKKMENELKGLVKDQRNYEDEITKCEKKIEEAKAALVENEGAQKSQEEIIKKQKGVVKEVQAKLKNL